MKTPNTYQEYLQTVKDLKEKDRVDWFSKDEPQLTEKEKRVDAYMDKLREELKGDRKYTYDAYAPALSFQMAREDIVNNTLFQKVFQKMPCGGNLHIHTSSMLSTDLFCDILAADSSVYLYWDPDGGLSPTKFKHGKFYYLTKQPTDKKFIQYRKIAEFADYPYAESKKLITFIDKRVDEIEYIWDGFNDYFSRVGSVLKVRSIYKAYYIAALRYQYEANNDYIEIRAGISSLVDNNDAEVFGSDAAKTERETYNSEVPETLQILFEAYRFVKENDCPDLKVKTIVSLSRTSEVAAAVEALKNVPNWSAKRKDGTDEFIVGFDLVSEEDINHKTDYYAEAIIDAVRENALDVNLYFHDGESNWTDNDNVHSAVALGTKRVGHGINIYNFPGLTERVKKDGICLEICPISNQMLRYIKDLRIHPIYEFLARGIQCVICSDDPQIFETAGTYYDLWEVYHGTSINLADLKKLIKNSYLYSAMNDNEKNEKIEAWKSKWNRFIDDVWADCVEEG